MTKIRARAVKYKIHRKPADTLFASRRTQVFFNSYIQRGQRGTSASIVYRAFTRFRQQAQLGHSLGFFLTTVLHRLRQPLELVSVRKSQEMLQVPVPTARLRQRLLALQILYKTVKVNKDRTLEQKLSTELLATIDKGSLSNIEQEAARRRCAAHAEEIHKDLRFR